MKSIASIIGIMFLTLISYSQTTLTQSLSTIYKKDVIGINAVTNWPLIVNGNISSNGTYIWYTIYNQPTGNFSVITKSLDGKWQKQVPFCTNAIFTNDCKTLLLKSKQDSLFLISLGSSFIEAVSNVDIFNTFQIGHEEYLLYKLKNKNLIIQNIKNGKKLLFANVSIYILNEKESSLLLKTINEDGIESLCLVNLITNSQILIYKGKNIDNIILDSDCQQLAFTISKDTTKLIMCFKLIDKKPEIEVDNYSFKLENNLEFNGLEKFSKDAKRLFIKLKVKTFTKRRADATKVDVWNYLDKKLQSQQLLESKPQLYTSVLDINSKSLTLLQAENEEIKFSTNDSLALITRTEG